MQLQTLNFGLLFPNKIFRLKVNHYFSEMLVADNLQHRVEVFYSYLSQVEILSLIITHGFVQAKLTFPLCAEISLNTFLFSKSSAYNGTN